MKLILLFSLLSFGVEAEIFSDKFIYKVAGKVYTARDIDKTISLFPILNCINPKHAAFSAFSLPTKHPPISTGDKLSPSERSVIVKLRSLYKLKHYIKRQQIRASNEKISAIKMLFKQSCSGGDSDFSLFLPYINMTTFFKERVRGKYTSDQYTKLIETINEQVKHKDFF